MTKKISPTDKDSAKTGPEKIKKLNVEEERFAQQLIASHVPYEREFKAIPGRKFSFDFRIKGTKILIEIQGGIWMRGKGAHSRPKNIIRDMEKGNLATQHGYMLYEYTPQQVKSGEAIKHLLEVL